MKRIIMMFMLMPLMALATTWYVDGTNGSDSYSGKSQSAAKKTIQAAIDVAVDGDSILVSPGTYASIQTDNKELKIIGIKGKEYTLIDGNGSERCAFLGNSTNESATLLSNFTLTNGSLYVSWGGEGGAGVKGGTRKNCRVVGCRINGSWGGYGGDGGGVLGSRLEDCEIYACKSLAGGGCMYSALDRCIIRDCYARDDGGGAYGCVMKNCLVIRNYGYNCGGGACGSGLTGCIANNCTIAHNEARSGGTILDGQLYNSIIYGNEPVNVEGGWNYAEKACQMHSCVTDDPLFVDAANDNYRLAADSPCIDTGDNSCVDSEVDLDGNARIVNGVVDIGCYEYAASSGDGLVAWYKFDGNANDSSGNGNDGVVHGVTLTTDRFGNDSSAYHF